MTKEEIVFHPDFDETNQKKFLFLQLEPSMEKEINEGKLPMIICKDPQTQNAVLRMSNEIFHLRTVENSNSQLLCIKNSDKQKISIFAQQNLMYYVETAIPNLTSVASLLSRWESDEFDGDDKIIEKFKNTSKKKMSKTPLFHQILMTVPTSPHQLLMHLLQDSFYPVSCLRRGYIEWHHLSFDFLFDAALTFLNAIVISPCCELSREEGEENMERRVDVRLVAESVRELYETEEDFESWTPKMRLVMDANFLRRLIGPRLGRIESSISEFDVDTTLEDYLHQKPTEQNSILALDFRRIISLVGEGVLHELVQLSQESNEFTQGEERRGEERRDRCRAGATVTLDFFCEVWQSKVSQVPILLEQTVSLEYLSPLQYFLTEELEGQKFIHSFYPYVLSMDPVERLKELFGFKRLWRTEELLPHFEPLIGGSGKKRFSSVEEFLLKYSQSITGESGVVLWQSNHRL